MPLIVKLLTYGVEADGVSDGIGGAEGDQRTQHQQAEHVEASLRQHRDMRHWGTRRSLSQTAERHEALGNM